VVGGGGAGSGGCGVGGGGEGGGPFRPREGTPLLLARVQDGSTKVPGKILGGNVWTYA
jgi:hypothetical protein